MPALSYSKTNIEKYDFEKKILKGIKIHTIRRYGPGLTKRPFKIGDTLFHYKNWRTPQVERICENKCLWVADICIILSRTMIVGIDHKRLNLNDYTKIAINDGFDEYKDFYYFFCKAGLPFYGQIIGWSEDINY